MWSKTSCQGADLRGLTLPSPTRATILTGVAIFCVTEPSFTFRAATVTVLRPDVNLLVRIEGTVSRPGSRPSGCGFAVRTNQLFLTKPALQIKRGATSRLMTPEKCPPEGISGWIFHTEYLFIVTSGIAKNMSVKPAGIVEP